MNKMKCPTCGHDLSLKWYDSAVFLITVAIWVVTGAIGMAVGLISMITR